MACDDLAANALTTLERVKEELGLTDQLEKRDRLLQRYINAASDRFEQMTNRSFYYEAARVEAQPGFGDVHLLVDKPPILDIDSITFDGAALASTAYEVDDAGAGIIYSPEGWAWTADSVQDVTRTALPGTENKLFVITYECGFITPQQEDEGTGDRTLPWDIEDAVIAMVVSRYARKGADTTITSERLMSYSVTYGNREVSSTVDAVVRRYARGR